MSNTLRHRGPDDEGYFIEKNIGLGFKRLSIIDLHSGHQPLTNEDDTIWIVFNGEIYNYIDLRKNLIQQGHIFKTKTDTEVIVHLYEQYGENCIQHLRGMFAFAIWDKRKQKLFCARDRFGIKPFYYYADSSKFIFASEIKCFKSIKDIDFDININALDHYFAYKFISADFSIFKSIKKLLPAHSISISFNTEISVSVSKYWNIIFEPDYSKSEEYWIEKIQEEFLNSVKLRMISDVPLGAFLSGGIDSSAVTAIMSTISSQPVKTFSIGFKEKKYDESKYARQIAQLYKTDHHEYILEPESIDILPQIIKIYDEPYAVSSAIPMFFLTQYARQFVTVMLSGDGGDELFAGYSSYSVFHRNSMLNSPKSFIKNGMLFPLFLLTPNLPKYFMTSNLAYYNSKFSRYYGQFALSEWLPFERNRLYNNELTNTLRSNMAEKYKERLIKNSTTKDKLSLLQEIDLQTYLVDEMLTKVDRASMANSIEVRVPIIDHVLAELSFKIPSHLKMNKLNGKYILKKALKPYLPSQILNRKKQGFNTPLQVWFKNDLNSFVIDKLSDKNNGIYNYLDYKYCYKYINNLKSPKADISGKIFTLLVFSQWLEDFSKGYS